jgi:uncharacterized membrane protein
MNASQVRRESTPYSVPWLLHPLFVSIGGTLLMAAFATDIMYSKTSLMQWSNASEWLIAVGLLFALFGAIALAIDVAGRGMIISWLDFALLAVAALLSLVNVFVHSRDAWTSVVPEGIWLSGIVTLLLLIVAIRGWRATSGVAVRAGEAA